MRKLVKLRHRLEKMSYCKFIILQLILSLLITIIGLIIILLTIKIFDLPNDWSSFEFLSDLSLRSFIKLTGIFIYGALIETIIFQFCTFFVFYKLISMMRGTKSSPMLYILVSSLLFGLSHLYEFGNSIGITILGVIKTALVGIVLATSFYITYRKKQKPLLTVSLIHFLCNEIVNGVSFLAALFI